MSGEGSSCGGMLLPCELPSQANAQREPAASTRCWRAARYQLHQCSSLFASSTLLLLQHCSCCAHVHVAGASPRLEGSMHATKGLTGCRPSCLPLPPLVQAGAASWHWLPAPATSLDQHSRGSAAQRWAEPDGWVPCWAWLGSQLTTPTQSHAQSFPT